MGESSQGTFPTVAELNSASLVDFSSAMATLFEPAPRFAARLAARRPFKDHLELLAVAALVSAAMPEDDQIELINAHPRLAATDGLSEQSRHEQGKIDPRADVELAALQAAYEATFGFRYLVFVAGRSRRALIPGLQQSLSASRESELHRALADTLAIAGSRLASSQERGAG